MISAKLSQPWRTWPFTRCIKRESSNMWYPKTVTDYTYAVVSRVISCPRCTAICMWKFVELASRTENIGDFSTLLKRLRDTNMVREDYATDVIRCCKIPSSISARGVICPGQSIGTEQLGLRSKRTLYCVWVLVWRFSRSIRGCGKWTGPCRREPPCTSSTYSGLRKTRMQF